MKRRIGAAAGVLVLAGMSGCWWGEHAEVAKPTSVLSPVRGTAWFKVVQPELAQGIGFFGDREVKMYWDDNTIFVKAGQALRSPLLPNVGEAFEFRGFEAHGEIALRLVEMK